MAVQAFYSLTLIGSEKEWKKSKANFFPGYGIHVCNFPSFGPLSSLGFLPKMKMALSRPVSIFNSFFQTPRVRAIPPSGFEVNVAERRA